MCLGLLLVLNSTIATVYIQTSVCHVQTPDSGVLQRSIIAKGSLLSAFLLPYYEKILRCLNAVEIKYDQTTTLAIT
eukprot:snap_masked-scaffold_13-processed-gene-1.30-mRNA-1 protein AED:1.00 eAED:1.00 QI:0/-1/0/0/-1/1/1/0/75